MLTNTVQGPGGDAAILRLKQTRRGIALTIDGNGRFCWLDPHAGGAIAVAEAARNLVCVGAEPLAATDCLNFGNPEKPEVYYQLEQAIRGMSAACEALGTPVVSGNVSLYNETLGSPIYPTPIVGMIGLLEDIDLRCGSGFVRDGDLVYLLGSDGTARSASLAGSEYARELHGIIAGRPKIDLELEVRLQRCCLKGIRSSLLSSAHDCADGGLAVTLAECCLQGGRGLIAIGLPQKDRIDAVLFGEAQSRIVVSFRPELFVMFGKLLEEFTIPALLLGSTGGERLTLPPLIDLPLALLHTVYETALADCLH
ncbi:MAG: AIR synthase related protein [Dehalococcoidia bacterium]